MAITNEDIAAFVARLARRGIPVSRETIQVITRLPANPTARFVGEDDEEEQES